MQARREVGAVKSVSLETEARIEKMARLQRETLELSGLLAEGTRLVNRPHDDAKCRFVRAFVDEDRIESFPVIAGDLLAEAEVEWSHDLDPEKTSIWFVILSEIEQSFRQVGAEPPAIAPTLATMLLSSDLGVADATLASLELSQVSVELILAHIEALGFRWPKRVKLVAARRVAVVLLNRHRFKGVAWVYDEAADEWERNTKNQREIA